MERCKFQLIQGDTRLEIEGPRDFVEGQLAVWRDLFHKQDPAAAQIEAEKVPASPATRPIKVKTNISIQEFFKLKNPHNDADRVVVAAYYLERYEHKTSFDRQDLVTAMGKVHSIPERLDGYIQDNLRKGYIVETSDPGPKEKPFSLTFSGEKYVKEGLQ